MMEDRFKDIGQRSSGIQPLWQSEFKFVNRTTVLEALVVSVREVHKIWMIMGTRENLFFSWVAETNEFASKFNSLRNTGYSI